MLTLTSLFSKAINARKKSVDTQNRGEKASRVPTSIRLSEQALEFYTEQAQTLCTTPSALVNQVLNLYAANAADPLLADRIQEIESRLQHVFDTHRLAPTDILELFNMLHAKHGRPSLTLHDLKSISVYIDDLILREIAAFFHWSLRWLKGQSDYINDGCNRWTWYKAQHDINNRLTELVIKYGDVRVNFFCSDSYPISQAYMDSQNDREPLHVGAVIEYDRELPNGKIIQIRQCLQIERWNYWRLRHHYKQFALYCSHLAYLTGQVRVEGYMLPESVIQNLIEAKIHPIDVEFRQYWTIHNYASFEVPILYETEEISDIFEEYVESKYYQSMITNGLVSEQRFNGSPVKIQISSPSM